MRRVRVIPVLLLQNGGLVKTIKFKHPAYIGDPINAVRIFNEKEVDELVILDITATKENKEPDYKHLFSIVSEAFMPLGYGGGIHTIDQVKKVFDCGIEKVIMNAAAAENIQIITNAASIYGSQSVVVSIDIKQNFLGNYKACTHNGGKSIKLPIEEYCKKMEDAGAGEIILTAIHREGTFKGYDIELIQKLTKLVHIPIVVNGGARDINDFKQAINAGASAVAAGSRFIYAGREKGILINYPKQQDLKEHLFNKC